MQKRLLRIPTTNFMAANRFKTTNLYTSEELFENWRNSELISAGFANLGLIFATLDYEFFYAEHRTHTNCAVKEDSDLFRYLILMSSIVALFFLCMRHLAKSYWKAYLYEIEGKGLVRTTFVEKYAQKIKKQSRFFRPILALEVLSLLIQPYPAVNAHISLPFRYENRNMIICYTLSELCYCFMFFRLLMLFRAIGNFTPYENYVARRHCIRCNVRTNMRFSFKCLLKMYPMPIVIFVVCLPLMLVLGCMVRIFERPLVDLSEKEWEDPLNGIWFMFSTMSTIGYGDYIPFSYLGRTVTVFGYIAGGFVFALIMVSVQKEVSLTENQTKAFSTVLLTNEAARTIQAAMRYHIAKVRFFGATEARNRLVELKIRIAGFKAKKKRLREENTELDYEVLEIRRDVKVIKEDVAGFYRSLHELADMVEGVQSPRLRLNSGRRSKQV
jgi:hypothetical protein